MKKISYILMALATLLVGISSCDLTRDPKATPQQKPFKTISDLSMNRDAVYALLRGTETPDLLNYAEYQGDLFHVNIFDNNSLLPLYAWQKQAMVDNGMINSYYASYYKVLMQSNYLIMRAEEMLENKDNLNLNDDDQKLIKQYIGEIKVIRALAHWRLVIRFSKPWDGATDNQEQNGIILMTSYDPLTIANNPKATRAEVYAQIMKDLDDAIAAIPENANKDVKPSVYINQDYAYALKARVALTSQNWTVAKECAEKVMAKYPLTVMGSDKDENITNLNKIWRTDNSDEIVVYLLATPQFGAFPVSLYGANWLQVPSKDPKDLKTQPMRLYLPSVFLEKWVVDLYSEDDLRRECYINRKHPFHREDFGVTYVAVQKFAGNKALDKDPNRDEWKVSTHLFNVGEAYLIDAEACYNLGQYDQAVQAIAKLQAARGLTADTDSYNEPDLLKTEIENERVRELIGEGWRFLDIVRWGKDMKRGEQQEEVTQLESMFNDKFLIETGKDLEKKAGDEMFIWEFPTRDIQNNPNLKAHKNWH